MVLQVAARNIRCGLPHPIVCLEKKLSEIIRPLPHPPKIIPPFNYFLIIRPLMSIFFKWYQVTCNRLSRKIFLQNLIYTCHHVIGQKKNLKRKMNHNLKKKSKIYFFLIKKPPLPKPHYFCHHNPNPDPRNHHPT